MNMIKKRTRNYCAPQTAGVYSLEYNPIFGIFAAAALLIIAFFH